MDATGSDGRDWLSWATRAGLPLLPAALGLAVVSALDSPFGLTGGAAATVVLVGLLGAAAGCARSLWRRDRQLDRPALAFVALAGAVAAGPDLSNLVMLVPVVAIGLLATVTAWRRATGLTVLAGAVVALVHLAIGLPGQSVLRFATLPLIGLFAGAARRLQLRRTADAERLLAETRRANEEQARAATLAERARLAREIHDVLAHSLGALTTQLGAADTLLDAERTEHPARAYVQRARQLAAEGLQESRRAVASLREGAPALPDLTTLAAAYQVAGGPPVTVAVSGPVRPLSPEVGLAVHRAGQEALANAGKHAPGTPVRVELAYVEDGVVLTVVSGQTRPAAGIRSPGFGLIGLRERAALLGGELSFGPDPHGWTVRLWLPDTAGGGPRAGRTV